MIYLFTAVGFPPGGTGRYTSIKIRNRQHKRRNHTQNNKKSQNTQNRKQNYKIKNKHKMNIIKVKSNN